MLFNPDLNVLRQMWIDVLPFLPLAVLWTIWMFTVVCALSYYLDRLFPRFGK